jgi:hypothetical protein
MAQGALSDADRLAEARALAHREAAEKLMEVMAGWSERSIPTGTPNSRSIITGIVPRGTIAGEIVDYMLQYKSFALSFTVLQMEAMGEMAAARGGGKGSRTGLAYLAGLVVPLTIGGGLYIQLKNMADGKEPEDMSPTNVGFWVSALWAGGGLGLYGDFLKSSENRFGQSVTETLQGPGFAFLSDTMKLTVGNAIKAAGNIGSADPEDIRLGREGTRFLRRYTPVLSSHWATRGAYNRLVLDNLQWLTDPDADKQWKTQARNAKKNGTEFFLPPGSLTP